MILRHLDFNNCANIKPHIEGNVSNRQSNLSVIPKINNVPSCLVELILPCVLICVVMLVSSNIVFAQVENSNSIIILRGGILGGSDYPSNGTYSQHVFFSGNVGMVHADQSIVVKILQGNLLYKTDLIPASIIAFDGSFSYETIVKGILGKDNTIVFIYGNQTAEERLTYAHTGIPSPLPPNLSYEAPLKQFKSGVLPQDVKCKEDLVLVIKAENGTPACVISTTGQKLLERGWVTPEKFAATHPMIKNNNTVSTASNNFKSVSINNNTAVLLGQNVTSNGIPSLVSGSVQPFPTLLVNPVTSSTNPGLIKVLTVGMTPNPLKVGDTVHYSVTFQNISDKPILIGDGCTTSPIFDTMLPSSSVLEYPGFPVKCADYAVNLLPNEIYTARALSHPLGGYYKILQTGKLNVEINLYYSPDAKPGFYIDTIQFNVNATQ
jgi:hypothetical protein